MRLRLQLSHAIFNPESSQRPELRFPLRGGIGVVKSTKGKSATRDSEGSSIAKHVVLDSQEHDVIREHQRRLMMKKIDR